MIKRLIKRLIKKMKKNNFILSLIEHLSELRKRLIYIGIVCLVSLVIGLIFTKSLIAYIKKLPLFEQVTWNVFSPIDAVELMVKFSFMLSLVITIPFAIYQFWLFAKPGLKEEEIKRIKHFVPFSLFFSLCGFLFSLFVVIPLAYQFMIKITKDMGLTETFGVTQFINFGFSLLLPITLGFQLPVVIVLLTKLKLINPNLLKKVRKPAYVILYIIAAMISPPDFISHFLVGIPFIVLFEISMYFCKKNYVPVKV